jgi:hypothetical protein
MGDFTKIEVGKIFPGPVPAIEGVQMELWHDMNDVDSDTGPQPGPIESI